MTNFENHRTGRDPAIQRDNYDLEKRTIDFSKKLVLLLKKCPKNIVTIPLIDQGLRAGTSIGANYREANGASSRKDFQNKIFICKKESKETLYWLELLGNALEGESLKKDCRELWKEAQEFVLIFGKIASSCKV